jgi:hypothetical protein
MSSLALAIGLSAHLGMQGDYNPVHPHVRWQDDWKIAGAYYNSMDRMSLYAGYRYEYKDFGAEFAIVTGYDELNDVVPMIRATYKNFFIAPAAEDFNDNIEPGIVIGFEYGLGKD